MKVEAVRQPPAIPPVEKVVIELEAAEARKLCNLIRDYREGWARHAKWSLDWESAKSEAVDLVNAIDRALA